MTWEDEASGTGRIVAEGKADQNLEASFVTQDVSAISRVVWTPSCMWWGTTEKLKREKAVI